MKPLNASRSLRTDGPRVVQPLGWRRPKGYANGIVAEGRVLFIAGQIGWDPRAAGHKLSRGFAAQFDRALLNVLDVLREAGGEPSNLARMTIYVTSKKEYRAALKQVGEAYRRRMGSHFPAMALIEVSSLLEDEAKVEIEATAVL